MMSYHKSFSHKEKGIGLITINRPEKLNALDRKTREEIKEVLKGDRGGRDIRVLVFTGVEIKRLFRSRHQRLYNTVQDSA